MARDINDIKNSMTDRFISNAAIQQHYGIVPGSSFLNEFSLVSLENIFFDILAFAIWTLENLWDIFSIETDQQIEENKIFKKAWYVKTALEYQHGFELDDFGNYINGDATTEEIEASKIVANVSFEKAVIQGKGVLRCKVVKFDGDDWVPLSANELSGFDAYINKKTGFGLAVVAISRVHDDLVANMKIWYDPLVINSDGKYRDGSDDTPVITAIHAYLKSIEFNGELVLTDLEAALKDVKGVKIPKVISASSSWSGAQVIDPQSPYEGEIDEIRVSFAGYMRLDVGESTFEYEPRNEQL
jgi:hypothetical protein